MFFVFVAIVSYTLIKTLYTQATVLNEKQDQLKEVQAEYNQIKENQEILKENITKLQDDEYVGKYARQEYYLSDEGEIIFSIPDKEVDDSVDWHLKPILSIIYIGVFFYYFKEEVSFYVNWSRQQVTG